MGTNCEACQGKHRAHTCKVVRRTTRGRTRRSPLEAVENALSFCAPGPRMLRMSCELCLAKDRKIAALELRLMDLESALIAAYDENIKEAEESRRRAYNRSGDPSVRVLLAYLRFSALSALNLRSS